MILFNKTVYKIVQTMCFVLVGINPSVIGAQEITASDIDVSGSTVHLAGPESLYIRSISYLGESYSVYCKADDGEGEKWVVSSIVEETGGLVPGDLILDFATLSTKDENILLISGIIVDKTVYHAELAVTPEGEISLSELTRMEPTAAMKKRVGDLAESLGAVDTSELTKTIEELEELQEEYKKMVAARAEEKEKEIPKEEGKWISIPAPLNSDDFTTLLHRGVIGGRTQLGSWKIQGDTITQTDSSQYFAKHVYPVSQHAKPTLFSFQGKSTGKDWVGFGLHIFAQNNKKNGYGYGDSLLIWITRDEEYYGSSETRLQLYRSDNEIHMQHVLDGIITEPIDKLMKIDVLYLPEEEYISIFVNGVEKLRYKTWFSIDSGLEVAFRTLGGGASFKNFLIKEQ